MTQPTLAKPFAIAAHSMEFLAHSRALHAPLWIVFLSGINLFLIQWVLVRELTALLFGTELVVLLVSVAYLSGLSLGYGVSRWIQRKWLAWIGLIALTLHISLPVWFRLLVAWLDTTGNYWLAFLVLPLLTPFVVSAFYSVFLPFFSDSKQETLPRLYATELLGSGMGIVLLVLVGGLGLSSLYLAYSINLLIILLLLAMRRRILLIAAVACSAWLMALPTLNAWSNARWYEALYDLPAGTTTLFSGYSPYQKVDVLEDPSGNRYLYLDGLLHYGTNRWSRLNVIMGAVSAELIEPASSLVVGAGSMEMERFIAERSGHVTTVELDPLVVQASTEFLNDVNRMGQLSNRSIFIDDAKHFMANSDRQYDLIATDVPAAFSIQTATLYSVPFYEQIDQRLTPQGVLVVNLTTRLTETNTIARRITQSLLSVFDDVYVVTSESSRLSFAFVGQALPFDALQLQQVLENNGETDFTIYHRAAAVAIAGDARPISLDSMDLVFQISLDWITSRLSR